MNFERIIKIKQPQMYGEDIKLIQRELIKKGFKCGEIDGYYRGRTRYV